MPIRRTIIPIYDYACRECEYEFSIFQKMSEEPECICPACKNDSIRRVINSCPHTHVKNYDTIGKLADKNWRGMGHYEKEDRLREDKVDELIAKKEKRQRANKIAKMTPEQQQKWIINGD